MKNKNRTFVIGDIHGGHKSLLQCLQRAKFDYQKDTLISLGDIADGWPDVAECFNELLKIKNLIVVRGNHDQWLLEWMINEDEKPQRWVRQGGAASLASYKKQTKKTRKAHKIFLENTPFYYIDSENRLFVHGGVEVGLPMSKQDQTYMMWDRSLVAAGANVPQFKEVYIGHTTVSPLSDHPVTFGNVTCMDTGGGWEWKLSMMNIDTGEVFQSDIVESLYPGEHS